MKSSRDARSVVAAALVMALVSGCGGPTGGEVSGVRISDVGGFASSAQQGTTVEPAPVAAGIEIVPESDPVASNLAAAGVAPVGLWGQSGDVDTVVQDYLESRLPDADVFIGGQTLWRVPGADGYFVLVDWQASNEAWGSHQGTVLVTGTDERRWVIESETLGVELGGLRVEHVGSDIHVAGYVALNDPGPFRAQADTIPLQGAGTAQALTAWFSQGESLPVDATVGVDHGVIVSVTTGPEVAAARSISEMVASVDRNEVQPVSLIDRLTSGRVGFRVDPDDTAPSQSATDAEAQGVPASVAELPLAARIDVRGRGASGRYQVIVPSGNRWITSRLPSSLGRDAELIELEGGADSPPRIVSAVELGPYTPSWIDSNDDYVYAGRQGAGDGPSMVIRVSLEDRSVDALVATDDPTSLPPGWKQATDQQAAAMAAVRNQAPDLGAVDAIFDQDG